MEALHQLIHLPRSEDDYEDNDRREELIQELVEYCISEPLHVLRHIFQCADETGGTALDKKCSEAHLERQFGKHIVEPTKINP